MNHDRLSAPLSTQHAARSTRLAELSTRAGGAPATAIPVVEFDEHGDVVTLYTDEIDLYELGVIGDVRRASHVEFDEANQEWIVLTPGGEVVHRDRNRERAIAWEIQNLGPGGKHYRPGGGAA
jgi:hypothetical protein